MITVHAALYRLTMILLFVLSFSQPASAKTYYHITVKAFLDPNNFSAVEWAWVTLVEIPKRQAFPEEAALAERYGGSLRGSALALVRADVWRSSHRFSVENRCNDRPSEIVISWEESWGDRVYAGGGLDNPNNPDAINVGFTTRPVLREDARWFDPSSQAYVVVGMPAPAGSPAVEMRGDVMLRSVNYIDPLKKYEHCGKRWTEQYLSAFNHLHIRDEFPDGGNEIFAQRQLAPGGDTHIVYQIIRSSSSDHPHWRRREM
jgi:hypothetical protein